VVGAWTCELLEAATHVAALVLEIQRALGGPPLFAGIRRDGAAPLIGSSRAIRQVRERIEQVAVPDFTIECPRLCRGIRYRPSARPTIAPVAPLAKAAPGYAVTSVRKGLA